MKGRAYKLTDCGPWKSDGLLAVEKWRVMGRRKLAGYWPWNSDGLLGRGEVTGYIPWKSG